MRCVSGDIEIDTAKLSPDGGEYRTETSLFPPVYRIVQNSPDLRFHAAAVLRGANPEGFMRLVGKIAYVQ